MKNASLVLNSTMGRRTTQHPKGHRANPKPILLHDASHTLQSLAEMAWTGSSQAFLAPNLSVCPECRSSGVLKAAFNFTPFLFKV